MSMFERNADSAEEARRIVQVNNYAQRSWSDVGQMTLERIRMSATFLYCKGYNSHSSTNITVDTCIF